MNQRKLGTILSYLNILVTIVSQFAYTPMMLRILGQSEYGVYSLSQSVIGYLSLLNFGFSGSYLRFYSKYVADGDTEGAKKLNALYVLVFIGIAALICLGGFFIIQNIEHIIGKKFNAQETVIKNRLVLYTINKLLGTHQNIEKVHIMDIVKLCENNIGNKFLIPNKNIKIGVNKGKIFFRKNI